jgi:hypothetical protein
MRKRYSLIKLLDGVRTMSDLTRVIAELTYLKNQLPNDAKVYLSFEGSCFDLCFSIVPKDKDDRKYYKRIGFEYDYKD